MRKNVDLPINIGTHSVLSGTLLFLIISSILRSTKFTVYLIFQHLHAVGLPLEFTSSKSVAVVQTPWLAIAKVYRTGAIIGLRRLRHGIAGVSNSFLGCSSYYRSSLDSTREVPLLPTVPGLAGNISYCRITQPDSGARRYLVSHNELHLLHSDTIEATDLR